MQGNRIEVAAALAQRRMFLCERAPRCPHCDRSGQVQLTDWLCTPAQWKCRHCRTRFPFEPPQYSDPNPPIKTHYSLPDARPRKART